ncbi:hypothetical protein H4R35_007260, partial [Dimargaris xerosporica]
QRPTPPPTRSGRTRPRRDTASSASRVSPTPPETTETKRNEAELDHLTSFVVNGRSIEVGDFIHAVNDDDSNLPHVAQVNAITGLNGKPFELQIIWYVRPDQTSHTPSRMFMEHELFRTKTILPLPVDQALEQCYVLPYPDYIRGRPANMAPNASVYVCASRYDERTKIFKPIKNWGSVIPAQVRGTKGLPSDDPNNWVPFDQPIVPKKVPSSFRFQGTTTAASSAGSETSATARTSRKRARSESVSNSSQGPSAISSPATSDEEDEDEEEAEEGHSPKPHAAPQPTVTQELTPTTDRSGAATRRSLRSHRATRDASPSPAKTATVTTAAIPTKPPSPPLPPQLDPALTQRLRCDAKGRVLWFSAPPVVGSQAGPRRLRHSQAYLEFKARQRQSALASD